MKNYLHFFGYLLLFPLLVFLLVITFDFVGYTPMYMDLISYYLAALILVVLFKKNINFEQLYSNINIKKTLIFSIISAIFLYFGYISIQYIGIEKTVLKPSSYSLQFLAVTFFLAPIFEELICRVIPINQFFKKLPNWVLIIGTSILFGVLHINFKNIYWAISTFFLAIILGYFFIRTKNAFSLILIHFFIGFIYIIVNSYFYKAKIIFVYAGQHSYWTVGVIVIALILIFGVFRKQLDRVLLKTIKNKEELE